MNPVHERQGQWWFWDETWAYAYGPYASEEIANQACNEYALWLDTGELPKADLSHGMDSEELPVC